MLSHNWEVIGADSMNNYYDVNLKKARLSNLQTHPNFKFYRGLVQDGVYLENIFSKHKPKIIVHLAAQAGVRYSIDNPFSYVESNLFGTFQILEMAKKHNPQHLLIASTSSVYGGNKKIPFVEKQNTDMPISFYAATKKSNEIMAHSYSHLFSIPTTMFRFFTVYGPWGRPDMALFKFTKNILSNKPIDIYNKGDMTRDFTYINDLAKAVFHLIPKKPAKLEQRKKSFKNDSLSDIAPFRIVNIGNACPINLLDFIEELESALGKNAKKNFIGMQEGDIHKTYSNIDLLKELTGFTPNTSLRQGVSEFVKWYRSYYS